MSCSQRSNPVTRDRDLGAVTAFELDKVILKPGPFQNAVSLNMNTLKNYEPDRLLSRFRKNAGLEPKAKAYGGWEGMSLAGHTLGHYMSGCALMYQNTGDQEILDRLKYIINELSIVQQANGGQYFAAFEDGKKIFEEEVAQGNIDAQSFNLNGIWAPFYTFHKLMSGLRDVYRITNNEEALKVEKNLADWIDTVLSQMNHDEIQEMLKCEFGGIQESLADLYVDTKDKKYLDLAEKFHHEAIIDPLSKEKDILPNIHGNTQIPKLVAATKLYEITKEKHYHDAAQFFWQTVVNHHSYVTGGHGNHEYFGQPDQLTNRLSNETSETCNVYNMLKLSKNLIQWKPTAVLGDFYERALFNHILSAIHPETGKVIYNLSLEMGGYKEYQEPNWFTCCIGSGMETHAKHAGHIYFRNDSSLLVNQFIGSELNWSEKNIKIEQITNYPEEESSRIVIHTEVPQEFSIFFRYPSWAQSGISVHVNEWEQNIKKDAGSLIGFHRKWQDGDTIDIKIPFDLRLEQMPDDENRIAIFYGPIVLAGDLGPIEDENAYSDGYVPRFMTESRDPTEWLEPLDGKTNNFTTKNVGHPRDVTLKPFYQTHDRRYSVYFDLYNEKKWEAHLAALEKESLELKKLDSLTFDMLIAGDSISETEHLLDGELLNEMKDFKGKNARGSERGGWLSFELDVEKGEDMELVIEYWGGFTGSKTFDILINDSKIATENISGKKDGQFINIYYPIPTEITNNYDRIKVRFEPHKGHRSGPFFAARTVKKPMEL